MIKCNEERGRGGKKEQRPTFMWKNNIKMNLRGSRWDVVDSIHLARVREEWRGLVNTVMCLYAFLPN
jgi:hypothetical protein